MSAAKKRYKMRYTTPEDRSTSCQLSTHDRISGTHRVSPWRWYIADAMLINGLDWDVLLPFGLAVIGLLIGWQAFTRRDLQPPK